MIIGAIWLCECLRGVGKSISALAYLGQVSVSFRLITSRPTELVKRKGGGRRGGDSAASSPEKRTRTYNTKSSRHWEGCMHECMDGFGIGLTTTTTTGMHTIRRVPFRASL
jgi:hypothetical protein